MQAVTASRRKGDMGVCGKCTVMNILRFMLYTCMLACTLLAATVFFLDATAVPASNLEGTLAGLQEPGYLIANSDLCQHTSDPLRVLILVTSAPGHFGKRQAIRLTWGHFTLRHDIAIAFFLGAVANSSLQHELQEESLMYSDIIQAKNMDTYNNLTLKTLSMLQWVNQYCSRTVFVLKTDDDVFINVPRLLLFTHKHSATANTIFGNLARNWRPVRSNRSKYYVSPKVYRDPLYPSFTTGPAYLMTGDILPRLTAAALKMPVFPLEDVFFTGIVSEELKIKRVKDLQFHPYLKKIRPNVLQVISIHNLTTQQQLLLWDKVAKTLI